MRAGLLVVLLLAACLPKQTPPKAAPRATQARFVFLGELHDNPRHHEMQARVLAEIVASGRRPAVVFEMLEVDQTPLIVQQHDPAKFGAALRWEERGWPSYAMYEPIIRIAMEHRLPIVAGNMSRESLMAASRAYATKLPPAERASVEDHVRQGHCGHADDAMVQILATAQEVRDAHLAQRMLASATADGAVLIAGSEHVNRAHGAPFHVLQVHGIDPSQVWSIGFFEEGAEPRGFDEVWKTAGVERPDPCVAFEEKLKKLHH